MTDPFDTSKLPTGEPDEIVAGDLLRWRRTDLSNDYDPTLYTLKYSARLAAVTSTEVEITATSDTTGFYVDEASATTAAYAVGDYYWQAYITRIADSERILVDSGEWRILSNFDVDTPADPRSHAKRMVDMIESVIENRADSDVIYYMIGGRAVSKMPAGELTKWRDYYLAEYNREQKANDVARGKSNQSSITVRFVE